MGKFIFFEPRFKLPRTAGGYVLYYATSDFAKRNE